MCFQLYKYYGLFVSIHGVLIRDAMCFQVEFILMGGTFMSLPADYRDYFIRNLHDALSGHTSANVEEAVAYSEHGATKCIGMTIET